MSDPTFELDAWSILPRSDDSEARKGRQSHLSISGHKLLNTLAPILGLSDRVYRVEIVADVTETAEVRVYERGTRERGEAVADTMRAFELVERTGGEVGERVV